jgi:hypothetical protein
VPTPGHLHELRRAAMDAAWASSCSCSSLRPLGLSNTLPTPHRSSKHRALPRTSLHIAGVLAATDTAAARHRARSPELFTPNPRPPIGYVRACGRPPPFPRPRATASSPESGHPRRRPALGPHCKKGFLPGASMQRKDLPVRKSKLPVTTLKLAS